MIFGDGTKVTSCAGGRHNMSPHLQVDLCPFDLESGVRVTCDLCVNFVFLGLSVLDFGPMYAMYRLVMGLNSGTQ